jgi:predicted phage-related endonuclease
MSVRFNPAERRSFIGGSDARIIMGEDEAALHRLWGEKRGEVKPEDLSGNLIVQLGLATENLNRHWFERNTGQIIECVQHRLRHPVLRWMGATLDGMVAGRGAVFEAIRAPSQSAGAKNVTSPCSCVPPLRPRRSSQCPSGSSKRDEMPFTTNESLPKWP